MSVVMKTNYESVLKITVILLFLPVLLTPAFADNHLLVITTDRDVYYNNENVVISGVLTNNIYNVDLIFSYEDDKFPPISHNVETWGEHLGDGAKYLGGLNFTLPTNQLDDYTGIITVTAVVKDFQLTDTEFYYTNQPNPQDADLYDMIISIDIKYNDLFEKYNVASDSILDSIETIEYLREKYDDLLEKYTLQSASIAALEDNLIMNDTPFRDDDTIDTTLEINIDKEIYHKDESVIVYGTAPNGESDVVHLKIYDGKLFRYDRDLTIDDGEYSFTFSLYRIPLGEYTVSVLYDDGYVDEYVEQTSFLLK